MFLQVKVTSNLSLSRSLSRRDSSSSHSSNRRDSYSSHRDSSTRKGVSLWSKPVSNLSLSSSSSSLRSSLSCQESSNKSGALATQTRTNLPEWLAVPPCSSAVSSKICSQTSSPLPSVPSNSHSYSSSNLLFSSPLGSRWIRGSQVRRLPRKCR